MEYRGHVASLDGLEDLDDGLEVGVLGGVGAGVDGGLEAAAQGALGVAAPDTNIVVLHVPDAAGVAVKAAEQGVLVSALGPRFLRLVTHLDLDDAATDTAIEVLAPLVAG